MTFLTEADIRTVSYAVCAVAFLFLLLLLIFSRTRTLYRYLMIAACAATTAWAFAFVLGRFWPASLAVAEPLELIRDVSWLAFVGSLLRIDSPLWSRSRLWAMSIMAAAAVIGVVGISINFLAWSMADPVAASPLMRGLGILRMLLSVTIVLFLENLFRNAATDGRWAIKYLCVGLGGIFAYDFLMYADAILFQRLDVAMLEARGAVNALAVPLLAVSISRAKTWQIDIQVSRNAVFHSFALMASGGYLIVMASAGYYLREFGGNWGSILQIFLVCCAIILLFVIFSSSTARSRVKIFISKNFYTLKYDYRAEWLRIIQAMSPEEGAQPGRLHDRVLSAMTAILDSPAGGLWVLREQDGSYTCTASRAFGKTLPAIRVDHPLVRFLETREWIVLTAELRQGRGRYEGLELPDWLAEHPRAWMIVPLIHRDTLRALLVMDEPSGDANLVWEDFDLLKTVGRQAASYLAEEHASEVLSDARKLEAFNQRFAFVVHDIKNLVSQMSLMMKNAERFGNNPEFQKDMLATVNNTVVRMKGLLEQLHTERGKDVEAVRDRMPIRAVLAAAEASWRKQLPGLVLDVAGDPGAEAANGKQLSMVIDHLLQNAIEAAGEEGKIVLRMRTDEREAIVEVEDNGPGMDPDFVRDRLFSLFDTKKGSGYGIGAYQTRQLVRELGGRLEVDSDPGRGTIMRVVLPLADPHWTAGGVQAKAV